MNSHESHDPDFPQEIPAIPDAEVIMPPEVPPVDADLGVDPEADPETTLGVDSETDLGADPDVVLGADLDADPPVIRETTAEFDPLSNVLPRLDSSISNPSPSIPPAQAAEVWTELDEAEPTAMAEARSTETRREASWSQARVKERGEPDPSVLDAGSGPRREAEKPGRTGLPYDDWEPSEVPYQPKELGVIDQLMIVLADGATIWRKMLRQVRSWLPRTWQRNLSDELMTAIALGLLILWLVLWNPLGSKGASPRVAVEKPEIPGPSLSQGDDKGGASAILSRDSGESAPATATETPTEVLAPSPEQSLIADIQDRVSKISRSYAVGLIQSVEVNLPQQVIAVNVSNDWYGLGAASQDRIAQDIYIQAQGLALATLQLRDPDGVVVARNPVVGPSMVILKRHPPAEGDPLA